MSDFRGVKRRPSLKVVRIDDAASILKPDSDKTIYSDAEQSKKKLKLESKTKEILIEPEKISYTPKIFSESEDRKLQQDIIGDPVRGYFYYEYLGDKLGLVLRYFTKKSGINLIPNRMHYLTFKDWDQFLNEYRFIAHDKELWRKIGNKIDIFKVASNALTYRRGLTELMNCIYLGYTRGKDSMNWALSHKLIFFASRCSKTYTTNLNIQYYQLLSKEFKEFFGFQSGFGNSLDIFIKRDSSFIVGEELVDDVRSNALKWTADEKDIFYESLARYSISRVDDIAALLPNKSTMDIMNFYNTLSKKLAEYKSDKKLRKKLISFEDMPIAYEMSELYVEAEEKFAGSIEKLDDSQFGNLHAEYRGRHYKDISSKCNELFITEHMDKVLQIINDLHAEQTEGRTESVVEFALLDMYILVREYIYELLLRLFRNKINELTLPQLHEWDNMLKSLKHPPNPEDMVSILNLRNLNQEIHERINCFDNIGEECSESDNDGENDFYMEPSKKEFNFMSKTNPQGIQILDNLDIWKVGITKEEVYEVSQELLKECNCSDELWMQLRGKLETTKAVKSKLSDDSKIAEVAAMIEEDETEEEEKSQSESTESEKDDDQENSSSSEMEDGDFRYSEVLSNAQDIDELQSEDELQNMFHHLEKENEDEDHTHLFDKPTDGNIWYDDDFIIMDAETELNDKGQLKKDHVLSLDFTTKGHEFLQKLCDYEEEQLEQTDLNNSLKHEHLLLTHLTSNETEDELNSKTFADLFSQFQYGGADITNSSWKPEQGGPASMFGNPEVKKNVACIVETFKKRETVSNRKKIDTETVQNFKYIYND